jgi:hypothetical protein
MIQDNEPKQPCQCEICAERRFGTKGLAQSIADSDYAEWQTIKRAQGRGSEARSLLQLAIEDSERAKYGSPRLVLDEAGRLVPAPKESQ